MRLDPAYQLRGWQGLPYALVNRFSGRASFVSQAFFHTLQLCNGQLTVDSPMFMGPRREHLRELDKAGFLSFSDEPSGIEPDQEYRYYDNHYIWQVHWSLTGRCNYRCRHCYMSAPHAVLPQPSTEECLRIADQITGCGVPQVSLTGGEPLIRPDFLQIVDRILEGGSRVAFIMTNGSLVTSELLDELEARGCRPMFNMSYDGTQGCHDWLRGVPGADDAVRRAFKLCHDRGFPTGAEFVLHKGNVHTLRESVKLLGDLGVSSLKVSRLKCVGEGVGLREYAPTLEEELEACFDYLPQYVEDGMPVPYLTLSKAFKVRDGRFSVTFERYAEGKDCSRSPMCRSARMIMYLGPDGRILPCITMSEADRVQERFPLVQEMTLAEALTDSSYRDFGRMNLGTYLADNPECVSCEYRNRCAGGCRAKAVLADPGYSLTARDHEACRFFLGGYYDRAKRLIAELQQVVDRKS
ncbi:MAG: radical SAM protein [Atopobiaceae bacterium]|nr:radical SAM protein [Atopobiaceae bacterium]